MSLSFKGSSSAKAKIRHGDKAPKLNLFERAKKSALVDLEESISDATGRWIDGKYATLDAPLILKKDAKGKDLPAEKWRVVYTGYASPNWKVSIPVEYEGEGNNKKPVKFQIMDPESGNPAFDEYGEPVMRNKPKDISVGTETVTLCLKILGRQWDILEAGGKTGQKEIKEKPKQVISTLKEWKAGIEGLTMDDEMGKAMLEFAKVNDRRNPAKKTGQGYKWSDSEVDFVSVS
jgi:hypothetical protein